MAHSGARTTPISPLQMSLVQTAYKPKRTAPPDGNCIILQPRAQKGGDESFSFAKALKRAVCNLLHTHRPNSGLGWKIRLHRTAAFNKSPKTHNCAFFAHIPSRLGRISLNIKSARTFISTMFRADDKLRRVGRKVFCCLVSAKPPRIA